MLGYTFDEFCATSAYGDFLRSRYREVNIPIDVQTTLIDFPEWLNWVVIVEEDTPDSLVILPIVQRMAEFAPRSSLYIMSAEDDLTLVDSALEDIELSDDDLLEADLPLLCLCNDEWQLLAQWGPRPQAVEPFLDQWLEQNPEFATLAESEEDAEQQVHAQLLDGLTYEMRVWYISELDHECCKEIRAVIESIEIDLESDTLTDADGEESNGQASEPDDEFRPMVGFEQDGASSGQGIEAEDTLVNDDRNARSGSDDSGEAVDQQNEAEGSKRSSSGHKPRDKDSRKEAAPKRDERRSRNRSGKRSRNRRPRRSNRSSTPSSSNQS